MLGLLCEHLPDTVPLVFTLPCILFLITVFNHAWLPSAIWPKRLLIVRYSSSLFDCSVFISFKTPSFIVGLLPS